MANIEYQEVKYNNGILARKSLKNMVRRDVNGQVMYSSGGSVGFSNSQQCSITWYGINTIGGTTASGIKGPNSNSLSLPGPQALTIGSFIRHPDSINIRISPFQVGTWPDFELVSFKGRINATMSFINHRGSGAAFTFNTDPFTRTNFSPFTAYLTYVGATATGKSFTGTMSVNVKFSNVSLKAHITGSGPGSTARIGFIPNQVSIPQIPHNQLYTVRLPTA